MKYLFFLFVFSQVFSQNISLKKTILAGEIDYSALKEKIIPFEYGTHIKVTVEILGEDYEFILDTGASVSLISPKLMEKIKATGQSKEFKIKWVFKDSNFTAIKVPEFKIEGVNFRNFYFLKESSNNIAEYSDIDGILGYNIIGKLQNLLIDYQTEQIIFNNSQNPFKECDYEFKLYQDKPKRYMALQTYLDSIEMNRKNFGFTGIDTGSPYGFYSNYNLKNINYEIENEKYITKNDSIIELPYKLTKIQDSNYKYLNIEYVGIDEKYKSISTDIGNDFLDDYICYFDIENNKAYLKMNNKTINFNRDIIFDINDEGELIVYAVRKNSIFDQNNIKYAYKVEYVNDIEIPKSMTYYNFYPLLRSDNFKSIQFVDNQGKEILINL